MNISQLDRLEGAAGAAAKGAEPAVHPLAGEEKAGKVRGAGRDDSSWTAVAAPPGVRFDRSDPVLREAGAVDAVLRAAQSTLVRMKEDLEAIVKIYPPYPPGSEERVDSLKSYNALRQEIDRITFPPRADGDDGAASEPAKGWSPADPRWEFVIDAEGRIRTVAREEGQGAGPLPAPREFQELAEDAPDEDVRGALSRIDEALETVQAKRSRLWDALEPPGMTDCYA